jgi:hypothetical protein
LAGDVHLYHLHALDVNHLGIETVLFEQLGFLGDIDRIHAGAMRRIPDAELLEGNFRAWGMGNTEIELAGREEE